MQLKTHIISISILFLLLPFNAFSAPSISGLSGTIADQSTLTITGTNFGSGPTISIWDRFEDTDGASMDTSADVGTWSSVESTVEDSYANSGNTSWLAMNDETPYQLQKIFGSGVTEIFISYYTYLPSDKYFPSATSLLTFNSLSAWKMAWIFDSADGYGGDDDLCLPTWYDSINIGIGGNDAQFTIKKVGRHPAGATPEWFNFGEWLRLTIYLKGGSDPVNDNGTMYFQALNATDGIYEKTDSSTPLFDGDDNANDDAISQWDRFVLPGWTKEWDTGDDGYDTTFYHDDVYIATGDYAQARVEVCNNSVYTSATHCEIQPSSAWATDEITITLNEGSIVDLTNGSWYLFVIDSDGTASSGYQLTAGESPTGAGTASFSGGSGWGN